MNEAKGASLFVDELLREQALSATGSVSMKHPFTCGSSMGVELVRELVAALERPLTATRVTAAFSGANVCGRCWTARFRGQDIHGVSAVVHENQCSDVRILLGSFPATVQWRDEVRAESGSLVREEAWQLLPGTDMSIPAYDAREALDANLPFKIASDIVFNSPVLTKGISGAVEVERVIGHAAAVYGSRSYGPRLISGAQMLSFWTASVSGIPIEVANLLHLNAAKEVDAMTMSKQPWPAVKLFRDRVRARTENFLDRSYFELND